MTGAVIGACMVAGSLVACTGDESGSAIPPSTASGVVDAGELLPLPGRGPTTTLTGRPSATGERSLFEAPSDTARAARIGFDELDDAIAAVSLDRLDRATTRVEIGSGGYELTLEGTGRPDSGFDVAVRTGGDTRRWWEIDVAGGVTTTWSDDGDRDDGDDADLGDAGRPAGPGSRLANGELAALLGATDIESALERLLLGPVRAATIGHATAIEAGAVVNVGTTPDPFGRRFVIGYPAASIREWTPYLLAPGAEAPPPGDDAPISVSVDVTSTGEIVRVAAEVPYGATTQRIVHRLEWTSRAVPAPQVTDSTSR